MIYVKTNKTESSLNQTVISKEFIKNRTSLEVTLPSNKIHTATYKKINSNEFNQSNKNKTIFLKSDALEKTSLGKNLTIAHSLKDNKEGKNSNNKIGKNKSVNSIPNVNEDIDKKGVDDKTSNKILLTGNNTITTVDVKNSFNNSESFEMNLMSLTHVEAVPSKEKEKESATVDAEKENTNLTLPIGTDKNGLCTTTSLNQTQRVESLCEHYQGDNESKHNPSEIFKIHIPINYTAGNLPSEFSKLVSNNSISDFNGEWETQPSRTSDITSLLDSLSLNWVKFFVRSTSLKVSINATAYPLHIKITPNMFFSRTYEVYVKYKDASPDSFTSMFTGVWKTRSVYTDGRLVTEAFNENIGKMLFVAGVLKTDPKNEYNSTILLVRVTVVANKIKTQNNTDSHLSDDYFWLTPKNEI